jgi:hypothetical protein
MDELVKQPDDLPPEFLGALAVRFSALAKIAEQFEQSLYVGVWGDSVTG